MTTIFKVVTRVSNIEDQVSYYASEDNALNHVKNDYAAMQTFSDGVNRTCTMSADRKRAVMITSGKYNEMRECFTLVITLKD